MSFLAKQPQLPQATAQDGPAFSTYKEGDAVPIGFGRDFFVSHWLSNKYDEHTAFGGQGKPEWQYCSIAAEYRSGPIDFVGKVKMNGKVITNFAYDFGPGEESHEFIINPSLASGRAFKAIVHRGTADAPIGIVANLNAATGQNHPPYRRRAWIEWINIDLGQGTTALPDFQVEMGVNVPAVGDYPGGSTHPYGVNPFAAVHALLRSEVGFDVDADFFDDADWGAQCLALEATGVADRTGNLVHCHPVVKTAQEAASLLSAILAQVDAFLYIDGGKFRIGWFPSQAPDIGTLPEITEHDLEAAPSGGDFPDWNRGASSVVVLYRDFDRDYLDTPALCPAPSNRERNVISTPARNERPMIHAGDQAGMIAAEISASRASSESNVTLTVQKSRAVKGDGSPLMPGDLFVWDYGPHSLDLVVRVVARRIRSGHTSDLLEIIPERGQFPLPYVPPVEPRVLPTPAAPGEINVADVRLWLLPSGLSTVRRLAPLVNRAHRGIYRADLHMSTAGAAPWSVILDSRFFVAKCEVTNGGINGAAATVRVQSTSVDFARMSAQNAVAQADNTLLVLIGDEVCSVGAITVVSPNVYDLAILRGRVGTAAAVHANGAVAWLFLRDELMSNLAEHAEFYRVRDGSNVYNAAIATKYFKLQLFTIDEAGLAKPDDPGISLQLPDLTADGTLAYTIVLSNEAHTVACNSAGVVNAGQLGAGSAAKTTVKVYRGSTLLSPVAAAPNSDQYSIALGAHTNATATKETNDTVRGDTLTADAGIIAIEVNVAGAFIQTKEFTLTKAKAGTNGTNGTNGSSVEIEYSVDGATSWHPTFVDGDKYMRQRIGSGAWSSAIRIVGIDGTNGTNGTRGSASFYRAIAGTAWSNTEADAAITAAGLTKVNLDTVTLYNTGAGFSETRFWHAGPNTWDVVAQVIDGNLIVHGTIGGDQLIAGISIVTPLIVGGLLKLNGTCTVCADTTDGSDNSIIRMNGGGGPNVTGRERGGQVDCLGNEFSTVIGGNRYDGSVLIGPGDTAYGTVRLRDKTGSDALVVKTDGNIDVAGEVEAGSFNQSSSRRFKKNVRAMENALETLGRLQGVTFKWKLEYGGKADFGFIAEEVEKVLPAAVGRDEGGRVSSVNYAKIVAVCVEAIRELSAKVERLEKQNAKRIQSRRR